MKFDYDEKEKVIYIDGNGTKIISKNNIGLDFSKEIVTTNDFKINFKNLHVCMKPKRFKHKLKMSISLLKEIWKK